MKLFAKWALITFLIGIGIQSYGQVQLDVPTVVHRKYKKETVISVAVQFGPNLYKGEDAVVILTATAPIAPRPPANIRIINPFPRFSLSCNGRNTPCSLTRNLQVILPSISANPDPYIGKQISISAEVQITGIVSPPVIVSQTVSIVEAVQTTYSLSNYLNDDDVKLTSVENVTSANNILTIYGKDRQDKPASRRVALDRNFYSIADKSFFWNEHHWSPVPISITTLPLQVRPGLSLNDSCCVSQARTGLTIPGINLSMFQWQWNRYFSNGKKSTHQFNIGIWLNPNVIELNSKLTGGQLTGSNTANQLFLGLAPSISYTYNDISFILLPYGEDFATTSLGEHYVFEQKHWWGIGIAIKPSILAPLFNK